MQRSKPLRFWPVLVVVVAMDALTKSFAEHLLVPQRIPHDVLGDWLRFTLVYNPGAAFGFNVGDYSRQVFTVLTLGALAILARLYLGTRDDERMRVLALALVVGGAVGNLVDRIRSPMGVVDFIDFGFGDHRWPTFNVADVAVSMGAVCLAWVLWEEDRATEATEESPLRAEAPAP
ncbi:MAG: Lipoprotein signal peptidase [Gemmatimonadetes bacterium]|nr:Lipoprotein signal peptidase [Gemmatimonadota bacterium]